MAISLLNNSILTANPMLATWFQETTGPEIQRQKSANPSAPKTAIPGDKLILSQQAKNLLAAIDASGMDPIQPQLSNSAPVAGMAYAYQTGLNPNYSMPGTSSVTAGPKKTATEALFEGSEKGIDTDSDSDDVTASGYFVTLPSGNNNSAVIPTVTPQKQLTDKYLAAQNSYTGSLVNMTF
ncbi:MAG: hypothetical protein LWX56_13670 [Ignavibacteria bacterium]|nr:hypothetical protein [Ignavibacteria bacterium]